MNKILALVLLLLCVGCKLTDHSSGNAVTFKTSQGSYALGDTVTVILGNNSSDSILYGNPFRVEQNVGGMWTFVGPTATFTLVAKSLSSGDKASYRFALADSSDLFPHHAFSEGEYRVTTHIDAQNDNRTLTSNAFGVSGTDQKKE